MPDKVSARADESTDAATPVNDSGLAAHLAFDALNEEIPAGEARAFLRKQAKLADKQSRLADEQMHFVRLRTKYYAEDLGIERLDKILKITVQALLILTGIVLVLGFGMMVWWASRSQSVVVDDFDSPPGLAQKGETGRVVASGVLDELTKMQAATRVTAAKVAMTNAWTGDIKIEVPETGVSFGELERTLRDNLGNDIHIGGSLVETQDGGLALTVRGDNVLPKTFTGSASELPKLSRQAAEYVYGEAEPYLYAVYLVGVGRYDDTIAFLPQAYARASEAEKPQLANVWGNVFDAVGRLPEAVAKYRLALSLKPHFWKTWGNLIGVLSFTEGEEASYRAGLEMRRLAMASAADDQPGETNYVNFHQLVQDWPQELRDNQDDAQFNNGAGSSTVIAGPGLADAAGMMHDWQDAAKYLAASDPDDPTTKAEQLLIAAYMAWDRDDYGGMIGPMETFYKQWLGDKNLQYTYPDNTCLLGLAYGMTGRMAEAEAVFKRVGRWVRCYSFRADALDHTGDWRAAIAAYRSAIALAPSLTFAYDRWGLALTRHGDLNGAAAAFREANRRGPHWAEPLKHWGDVLMRQHRPREAGAKYAEALKYAPKWEALRAARAKAQRL